MSAKPNLDIALHSSPNRRTPFDAGARCREMSRYIRARTPGATYFFTVVLQDRSARYLVDHVAELRACFAEVKAKHPFAIDAMVVLPAGAGLALFQSAQLRACRQVAGGLGIDAAIQGEFGE